MGRSLFLLSILLLPLPTAPTSWRAEVNLAIDRGIQKLLTLQKKDGSFQISPPGSASHNERYPMGVTALALYTLLKSGLRPDDPAIIRTLEFLRYQPFKRVYSVSTLILALDAMKDPSMDPWIQKAAKWLVELVHPEEHIWAYPEGTPDFSNTQFAVLALWFAEQHGFQVPKKIWVDLINEAVARQNNDGGFGYRPDNMPESSGSMTSAGITILTLALWRLEDEASFFSPKRRARAGLERAWAYMDRCFTTTGNFGGSNGVILDMYPHAYRNYVFHFYYLYGLERICALSRRNSIGGRDWYREGALYLLSKEEEGGGWGILEPTCFALLFLRRAMFSGLSGRHKFPEVPNAVFWRYITSAPPQGWAAHGFDDSGWSHGAGGFGRFGNPGGVIRTVWESPDIWIRRTFEWNEDSADRFRLFIVHDDHAEIYVNGVLAEKRPGYTAKLVEVNISDQARSALKKGSTVVAAHCQNTGGAQILDIRLKDFGLLVTREKEDRGRPNERWWKGEPLPEVPFIKRWLVLGPLTDPRGALMLDSLLPDEKAAPWEGQQARNLSWKAVRLHGSFLDFEKALRPRDECIYYAFTYLQALRDTEAILWIGADDGFRVFLDGEILLSHYAPRATPCDGFSIPVRLTPGVHSLLIKVREFKGASGLYGRLSRTDRTPAPEVRPILSRDYPDWDQAALAHPSLFALEELLHVLPTDPIERLDFSNEDEMNRAAIDPCRPGFPRWLAGSGSKESELRPNPGARGILALSPPSQTVATRMIRKVSVPKGRISFEAKVSAEAYKAPAGSECWVKLGVFDGKLRWFEEERVSSGTNPREKNWQVLKADLKDFVNREILLIVECAAGKEDSEVGTLFIDEASLR